MRHVVDARAHAVALENPYAIEADAKHAKEAERAKALGAQMVGSVKIDPTQLPPPQSATALASPPAAAPSGAGLGLFGMGGGTSKNLQA